MDAGRELDALVAEKVFDRVVCRTKADIPEGWRLDNGETVPGYRDGTFVYTLPQYSREIDPAWDVYLKVMEGLFSQRARFYDALQMQTRPHMGRERLAAWPDVLTLLRHEMPLAICRAALAAVSRSSAASDAEAPASQA